MSPRHEYREPQPLFAEHRASKCGGRWGFGHPSRQRYAPTMCGRARLSSDVGEIKLVFSIRPHRPTPNIEPSWNAVAREAISFPAATQTSVL
jgi:hypothetical protein